MNEQIRIWACMQELAGRDRVAACLSRLVVRMRHEAMAMVSVLGSKESAVVL
jgi:hypothetical protein